MTYCFISSFIRSCVSLRDTTHEKQTIMTKNEANFEDTSFDNERSVNSTDITDIFITDDEVQHPFDVIGGWGPTQQHVVFYTFMFTVAAFTHNHTTPSNVQGGKDSTQVSSTGDRKVQ